MKPIVNSQLTGLKLITLHQRCLKFHPKLSIPWISNLVASMNNYTGVIFGKEITYNAETNQIERFHRPLH